jgi:hypothetical protein
MRRVLLLARMVAALWPSLAFAEGGHSQNPRQLPGRASPVLQAAAAPIFVPPAFHACGETVLGRSGASITCRHK